MGEGGGGRGGGGGPRRGHHGVPVGDVEQVGVLAAPCTWVLAAPCTPGAWVLATPSTCTWVLTTPSTCTWVVPGTGVVLLAGRCHHAAVEGVEGGLVEVV